jgi:DNA-binding transcriptional LysR family regulator
MRLAVLRSRALVRIEAFAVSVEIDLANGLRSFTSGGSHRRIPIQITDSIFQTSATGVLVADAAVGGGLALTEGLIARELSRVRIVLAAAPAYLERYPVPAEPAELSRHRGILRRSIGSGRLVPWAMKNDAAREVVAAVLPVAVLDDPEAMARAAACGMGVAMLPLPHALPLLESGALVRILPGWYADTRPLSIYYASRKLVPAKVRVFVDYMVEQFGARGYAGRFAGH